MSEAKPAKLTPEQLQSLREMPWPDSVRYAVRMAFDHIDAQAARMAELEAALSAQPDTRRIDWIERYWVEHEDCPIGFDEGFFPTLSGTYESDMGLRDALDAAIAEEEAWSEL